MFLICQGMAKQVRNITGLIVITSMLSACGSGSSSSNSNQVEQPSPEPTIPAPTPVKAQIVPFDFKQIAQNQPFKANRVQLQSFVNATGAFRLPLAEQSLTGNLTIAIDLDDPDGIQSAYVGFNGSASAIELCNQTCNATTYQRTVTGVNPLDHGMHSGQLQLNLMVGDTQGNLTTVSTVSFNWQQTSITGLNVTREAGAINLDWNGISNYLRYNVYTASQDGVSAQNYQDWPDGQAILAVKDPALVLTGKEDAKTFYATVTGVNGSGESAFGDVTKIVALAGAIDNPPTASNDSYTMDEDTTLSQNLLDNDFDGESQTLTVNTTPLRAPQNGSVTINADGSFEYTPKTDFNGRDNFRYQISDGLQQTDYADVIIAVNQGNDAPESFGNDYNFVGAANRVESAQFSSQAKVALSVAAPGLLINDLDIDNNSMSIVTTAVSEPTQGTLILNADGSFSYEANPGASGEDQFTYQSTDGNGGIAEATVRITINGDSFFPRAATDRYSLSEGSTLVVDNSSADKRSLLANDTDLDTNDVLTISTTLFRAPIHGTVNLAADGTFTYFPEPGYYGVDTMVYEVTDQQGHVARAGVLLTINRTNEPPIAANDTYTLDEDTNISLDATAGLMANDSDVDFDPLSIDTTPVQQPSNGQVSIGSDGSFSYQPNANFFGSDSFRYRLVDDSGASNEATVTFTIANINDPPIANDDAVLTGIDTSININVLQNDRDIENQSLTIVSASADTGTVSISADQTLNYTPASGFEGSAVIDYSIDDGIGVTASAKVFVTISNTNNLPVAVDDSYSLNEDQLLTVNGNNFALLTINDSDPEGNTLTVNTTAVSDVSHGSLTLFADGRFTYQPNSNFNGTDQFIYQINDGFGGTASASVSLTITPVNDTPVAVDDTIQSAEDTLININVLANDTDIDNDPLLVSTANANNGNVTINGDGTVDYTPNANFNGLDTLSYSIQDSSGASASAIVNITVVDVNDPPNAQNDSATTLERTPVIINVLANDTDIDGDSLSILSANASSGSITVTSDNQITYTPNIGFNGADTIDYTISDGRGGSAQANVFVTVQSTNDNPVAQNDSATIAEDSSVTLDVVANDSDIDGDSLSINSATASIGTVTISQNRLNYQPPQDFNGSDTIDYSISDGQGGSAQAQVFLTITPVNDNPIAQNDSAALNEDSQGLIDVLANDSDVDNSLAELSVTAASAQNGSVSITTEKALLYVPNGNFNGNDTISYTISDSSGGFANGLVLVTVVPQNDAPIAQNDSATITEDSSASINVLANDSDPDNEPLSVISATATHGSTAINADGSISYVPNANFNGTDQINYMISDNAGLTASATVTASVTPVNDPPIAQNDIANTSEDVALTIAVLANDSDIDSPQLSVTTAQAQNGQVQILSGSALLYTPAANFNGNDIIAYTISDNDGATASAQVQVSVGGVNDIPVAQADTASTQEDQATTINVLANDSDADGDNLSITSAQSQNGSVVVSGSSLNYLPNLNFNGSDTISYSISDGQGGVASSTVAVTIEAVNDTPIAVNDSATVAEDGQTLIIVLANDSDIDGDTLTVLSASASFGTVSINANQSLSYTPNSNFNGSDTINYQISDPQGATASASVLLSITPTNDSPVANNDQATTSEDTLLLVNVLANDSDIDGDTLSVISASATNGNVSINNGGSLNYIPNSNFNGQDSISYIISDGNGGTATGFVAITVTAVNDLPVANSDNAATQEDSAVSIAPLNNDSDIDGDNLTITQATASNGEAVIEQGAIINYTPAVNYNGVDTISYQISDGQGGTAQASIIVTISAVNDTPIALNDIASTQEDTQTTINVLANDSDADNDALTLTSASAISGVVSINPNGSLNYTPNSNFNGLDTISYQISDSQNATASATVAITVAAVNDQPVTQNDTATTDEDITVTINVLSNDSDVDGDSLSITSATTSEGEVLIDSTLTRLEFTPTSNFHGNVTINYAISDGHGGAANGAVALTVNPVNDHPTIVADTHIMDEDATSNIDPLANDSDVDGDVLSITSATASNGTVTIVQAASKNALTNSFHTLNYVPNANYNGPEIINYSISDGNGGSATSTVTVTINPVNDIPVANNDSATTNEDTPARIDVLANDTDADGEPLTIQSASALHGSVEINSAKTNITYTPVANYHGQDSISYTITDPQGITASASVSITINAVNDLPVAQQDSASLDEDSSANISVLSNDSDVDGDTLTVTSAVATNGVATINANGTIGYVPNANFNGQDTIEYAISDGNNGVGASVVNITVNAINDIPVASPDSATTDEDTATFINVLTNDTDVDGDPLTVSNVSASNGIVSILNDQRLSYTPNQNFNGQDTVSYQINDGHGGTATSTVLVTINPVNDIPVVQNDTATTDEDNQVSILVLTNDSDIDGDLLSVVSASAANGAVVIVADSALSYTPNANFNGSDEMTYTVSDGNGGSASAKVSVTVTPVNDEPLANADQSTINEDETVIINVLSNDSDIDLDTLTVSSASAGKGAVVIEANQSLKYTPDSNINGQDTISYSISDGNGGSAQSTVSVTITPVNDLPIAVNDVGRVDEDNKVVLSVLANDSDIDGDTLSITAASALNGVVEIQAGTTLSYKPDANYHGVDTLSYTISDGNGGSDSALVAMTVNSVNDLPVANADTATTIEDTKVTINVLLNDSDADGDTLTVSSASAVKGVVIIERDSTLAYTPNANEVGEDKISYAIADGQGGTAQSYVTVTITAQNDAPIAVDDSATTDEDTKINIKVLTNDSDPDNDTLTITSANAAYGDVQILSGTSIDYTPNSNYNGSDTISYSISDGNGQQASANVLVTIKAVNDDPVAANDTATTDEERSINITVLINDSDPDNDTLTITAASAANGTVLFNSGTSLDYTPALNFSGNDTLSYTISDGNGGTSTASVTVAVNAVNDDPIASPDTYTMAEDAVGNINVLSNDSDPDGDSLSVVYANASHGVVTINSDQTIDYVPGANFNGSDTLDYTISDGVGGTAYSSVAITVTPVNDAPFLDDNSSYVTENSATGTEVLTMVALDVDNGDTLSYSIQTNSNGIFAIDSATGVITVDDNGGLNFEVATSHSIVVKVTDSGGASATATVTISVTDVEETVTPTLDTAFGNTGIASSQAFASDNFDVVEDAIIDANGKIIVAGYIHYSDSDLYLARFNADGSIDRSFGIQGVVNQDFGLDERGIALAIDNASRIVVAGTQINGAVSEAFVARYTTSGTLDSSFNGSGYQVTSLSDITNVADMAIAPDSSILVVANGAGDFRVIKFNSDGSIAEKRDFDIDSGTDIAYSIALQSDGKAIISGTALVSTPVLDLVSELIPLATQDFAAIRVDYSSSLTLDTSYSGDGIATFEFGSYLNDAAFASYIDANDQLLLVGGATNGSGKYSTAAAKVNVNGDLVTSFGNNGLLVIDLNSDSTKSDFAAAVDSDSNGNLYLGVESSVAVTGVDAVVYKMDANGVPDNSYGISGQASFDYSASSNQIGQMLIDGTDKATLAVVGTDTAEESTVVARFNSSGSLDTSFHSTGYNILDPTFGDDLMVNMIALKSGSNAGKFAAVGFTMRGGLVVARYNSDGSIDDSFGNNGYFTLQHSESIYIGLDLAELSDGRLVVTGQHDDFGLVVMLTTQGSIDGTFANAGMRLISNESYGLSISAVSIDKNNKIVVGGTSLDDSESGDIYLARLNLDGSFDSNADNDVLNFNNSGNLFVDLGNDESLEDLITLADGSIIGVGRIGQEALIIKVTEAGNIDSSNFAAPNGYLRVDLDPVASTNNDMLTRVKVKNSGKIVASGFTYEAANANVVVQLNANGSLDTSFDSDGIVSHNYGSGEAQTLDLDFDAQERIIVTGNNDNGAGPDIFVARIADNGTKDLLFNSTGGALFDFGGVDSPSAIKVLSDGSLVVAGSGDLNRFPSSFFYLLKIKLVEP